MTTEPLAPVNVTILDVYTRQVQIQATLAVIQEQLKAIPDHEHRIRVLETSRSRMYGAVVAISTLITAAGSFLSYLHLK